MADRIDHVAEALSLLATPAALAESIKGVEEVSEDWVDELRDAADRSIAAAQVHATLALVEQTRVANLIALMDSPRTATSVARVAERALTEGEPVVNRTLRPDIAAALGIPTTHPEETP